MATAQKTETGWDHAERHKPEPNPKFSGAVPVAASVSPAVSAPAAAATSPVVPVAPVPPAAPAPAPVAPVQTAGAPVAAPAPTPKLTLAQRIKAALEKAEGATEAEIENILEGK